MKKVKVIDLSSKAVNYAVAMIEFPYLQWGVDIGVHAHSDQVVVKSLAEPFCYSPYSGSMAEDIIDREGISVIRCDDDYGTDAQGFCNNKRIPVWAATIGQHTACESTEHQQHEAMYQIPVGDVFYAPTRRLAAMRCYVAYALAKHSRRSAPVAEVEVPEELL